MAAQHDPTDDQLTIVAALFTDDINLRPIPGPSTRIDLTGVQFSAPAPTPVPCTVAPHLVVLVWCPPAADGFGALEVVFERGDDVIARNVQALQIESGKFNYNLVRAELAFDDYGTIVARCRIGDGPVHSVPYTLGPPVQA